MTCDTINDAVTFAGCENPLLAGRYQVVRQLGAGGMGSVWLAEDRQLDNKMFAVKMLPSVLVSNKRAYRQLKDEALVAMRLVHPNIVQIRAFEENNGNPFLVMDYIEGQTLDDYLAEKGKLSEDETIRLLKPIAAALDYAHGEGVVHRDVKPANIMIRKDGHPYILDFGIAREIQETMTRVTGKLSSGTLLYMSPEQLRGQPPKAAQDVYSFAAMAYECLKGEPPFSRGQIEYQVLNEKPAPLPDGVRLSASIIRGLSKEPAYRPDSCAKVLLAPSPMKQQPSVRQQTFAAPKLMSPPMAAKHPIPLKNNPPTLKLPVFFIVIALLAIGCIVWYKTERRNEAVRLRAIAEKQEEAERQEKEREAQAAAKLAELERQAREELLARRKEAERKEAEKRAEEQRKTNEENARLAKEAAKEGARQLRQKAVSAYKAAVAAQARECAPDEFASANILWTKAKNAMDKADSVAEFESCKKDFATVADAYRKSEETANRIKAARDRAEENARKAQGERLAAERIARFEKYASVELGSFVQITLDADKKTVSGVLISNMNNKLSISRSVKGSVGCMVTMEFSYDEIASLEVRDDLDGNAAMRKLLIGTWSGTTQRTDRQKSNNIMAFGGGNEWSRQCSYTWTFSADGRVSQFCRMSGATDTSNPQIKIGASSMGQSGEWKITDNGAAVEISVTSGVYTGKKFRYKLIRQQGDRIEFKTEDESLKNLYPIANPSNERHWYDNDGKYHYEGVCKTSNAKKTIVETPRVFVKVR